MSKNGKVKNVCRFCGAPVDALRVEIGRDYCKTGECLELGLSEGNTFTEVGMGKFGVDIRHTEDCTPENVEALGVKGR